MFKVDNKGTTVKPIDTALISKVYLVTASTAHVRDSHLADWICSENGYAITKKLL